MEDSKKKIENDELSLKEILSFFKRFIPFWKTSLLLLIVPLIIVAIFGYFSALVAPVEYDATSVLITDQVANSSSGSLSNLAALAGVQVPAGSSEGSLGADIYPLLLSNRPFLLEFSQTPIYFDAIKDSITLQNFFEKNPENNFFSNSINFFWRDGNSYSEFKKTLSTKNEKNPFNSKIDSLAHKNTNLFLSNQTYISELTSSDKNIISILQGRIKFDQTGKFINVSVKMPDPKLSAETTKVLISLMIKYITNFKLSKQLEDFKFLEERTLEAEVRYKKSQIELANFKDSNYNVVFESYKIRGMQLENEFTLSFGLYNQFVSQLEQAKVQLKKETPLFTMVEPVYIPDAVSLDPMKSIFSFISFGLIFGILLNVILFFKILLKKKV
jgi:capsule polysaccharide export protein KpsE/RkpR